MTISQGVKKRPSNLADVLVQVREALDQLGVPCDVLVGRAYEGERAGGPRVLFVPEVRGKLGPPLDMGFAASHWHGCEVYVRARDTAGDLDRFREAQATVDTIVDYLSVACTGRIEWGEIADNSPTQVETFGAELAFWFSFERQIPHDESRQNLVDTYSAGDDVNVPLGDVLSPAAVDISVLPAP